jgi:hypothetical protein
MKALSLLAIFFAVATSALPTFHISPGLDYDGVYLTATSLADGSPVNLYGSTTPST